MNEKRYQAVFITHLPSFYKINLYNEIAKRLSIHVIFIASGSSERESDFTQQHKQFDYTVLNEGGYELRPILKSCKALLKKLKTLQFEKCIIGGWDLPEFWLAIMLLPKSKNCLVLESSIFESNVHGLRKFLKAFFLKRVSKIFYSGKPHLALIEQLNFAGEVYKTLGVGLTHYDQKYTHQKSFQGRFLYVGRLAKEKNLLLLLRVFAALPDLTLTIIGDGPLKDELYQKAPDNVKFLGHIPYARLPRYYQEHDAFILPSVKEPWGLVVEEAIYYDLPIIASKTVGASVDLVEQAQTGVLFDPLSEQSLISAITELVGQYAHFRHNVRAFDFNERDQYQVQAYVEVLSESTDSA